MYGWEDAYSNAYGMPIERSLMKTSHDVVSQAYYNTWESGAAMKAYQLANNGYKVHVYLSHLLSVAATDCLQLDPDIHWFLLQTDK